jgi:hypothetical protein
LAVDCLRPFPVEVGDRFECADARGAQSPIETAPLMFGFLNLDEFGKPRLVGDFRPASNESE